MCDKGIEFFCGDDGRVWFRQGESSAVLSTKEREIVVELLDIIRRVFPVAYARLCLLYKESRENVPFYEFKIVERFVRCNLGEDDCQRADLDDGRLCLERVKCPLRGMCKDEGVICSPEARSVLSREEAKVARLYSCGYSVDEIARLLNKSFSTVNNQLWQIKCRLKLGSRREVMAVCRNYNLV